MVYQWINNHYDNHLEYYKGYQKFQNCKENLFPDRPEEAAMFGCESLSTELENLYKIELYNRMRGLVKIFNQHCLAVCNFWDGYSLWSTPCLWACPCVLAVIWFWCCSCTDTSHSVKQGYKATLLLVARIPLRLGGSTLDQVRRHQFVEKPDTEGSLPITCPPSWSCKPWLGSVSNCVCY